MSHKPHVCDSCAKICEEAKSNVKKLQKKIYVLTIVCTSAITLLGEQGGKALLSSINTVNSAMSAASGKEAPKEENKKDDHQKLNVPNPLHGAWIPPKNKLMAQQTDKEPVKKYEIQDELSRIVEKKEEKKVQPNESKVAKNLTVPFKMDLQPLSLEKPQNDNIPSFSDNFAVFYTPSLLPFDVYSTTLALGDNYGFGDYYGINSGRVNPIPVPNANTLSILTFSTFINSRKRTL